MRGIALGLALALTSCGGSSSAPRPSQAPAASSPPAIVEGAEPAKGDYATPPFFRIEGATGAGYLLGTMHLGMDAEKELHPEIWRTLESATTFVTEADSSKIVELIPHARLPRGETLEAKLEPATWKALLARLGRSIPEPVLQRSKPWFVSIMAVQQLYPSGHEPMDETLRKRSEARGTPVVFLEDLATLVPLFDEAFPAAELASLLAGWEEIEAQLKDAAAAYRRGDLEALTRLFDPDRGMAMTPRAHAMLVVKRNRAWLPRIRAQLADGTSFIAVGAGHLVGPDGIVALLEGHGYRVTRVPLD